MWRGWVLVVLLPLVISTIEVRDYIDDPDLNYYYGAGGVARYRMSIAQIDEKSEMLTCTQERPYSLTFQPQYSQKIVNRDNFVERMCFACEPPTNATAKSLFNLDTRQCEPCTPQKTAICNALLSIESKVTKQKVQTLVEDMTNSNITAVSSSQNTTNQANQTDSANSTTNKTSVSNQTAVTNITSVSDKKVIATTPSLTTNSQPTVIPDVCPSERPLYNSDTKLCDTCPHGQEFIPTSQACFSIIFITRRDAPNLLGSSEAESTAIQGQNPERTPQECPLQTPYLQNGKCIACNKNWLFNVSSDVCLEKCPAGQFYNSGSQDCKEALYITDSQAANLVSQIGSYDVWKADLDQRESSSIRINRCPSHIPFSINNKCANCPSEAPFYDIDKEICVACGRGRTYSITDRRCKGQYEKSSSLRRIIGNVQ